MITRSPALLAVSCLLAGAVGGVAFVIACGLGPDDTAAQGPGGDPDQSTCTCNVNVTDELNVITPDTDPARLTRGYVPASTGPRLLTEGPFVLTDVSVSWSGTAYVYVVSNGDCASGAWEESGVAWPSGAAPVHGARFLIGTGETLCLKGSGDAVSWAGFVP